MRDRSCERRLLPSPKSPVASRRPDPPARHPGFIGDVPPSGRARLGHFATPGLTWSIPPQCRRAPRGGQRRGS
jgi:hypothetical protein